MGIAAQGLWILILNSASRTNASFTKSREVQILLYTVTWWLQTQESRRLYFTRHHMQVTTRVCIHYAHDVVIIVRTIYNKSFLLVAKLFIRENKLCQTKLREESWNTNTMKITHHMIYFSKLAPLHLTQTELVKQRAHQSAFCFGVNQQIIIP